MVSLDCGRGRACADPPLPSRSFASGNKGLAGSRWAFGMLHMLVLLRRVASTHLTDASISARWFRPGGPKSDWSLVGCTLRAAAI